MRRYLGALVTIPVVAALALGCVALGNPTSGGLGGGGGGTGGPPSGTGGSASASAGAGGGGQTGAVDTSPPPSKAEAPACVETPDFSSPIFLSVPRARAMVSGAQVRGMLEAKSGPVAPVPGAVRTDEILNYYHIAYPAQSDTELTVVADPVPTGPVGDYLLQIGVQAPTVKAPRRPTSLTVLVDSSTSMAGESMLRANAAVLALARSLNKGDVLNLLTTDSEQKPVHRRAESDGDPALFSPDQPLQVSGAGSLGTGVEHAYEAAIAEDSYVKEGINRVVVITDGGGLPTAIDAALVDTHWTHEQIRLVGVGVGSAPSYHNELLAAATRAGHGPNLYLDSVGEADPALHQRFDEVMDEAVNDLTVSFSLPWLLQSVNLDASGAEITEGSLVSSDLARGRSMVFRHIVTACSVADIGLIPTLSMYVTASWSVPGLPDRQSLSSSVNLKDALHDHGSIQTLKTSAILAFGSALQSLQVSRFQVACKRVAAARLAVPQQPGSSSTDPELDSILTQIQSHPVMKGVACP